MKAFLMLLAVVCLSLEGCAWLRPPTEPSAAARKSLGDSKVRTNPGLNGSDVPASSQAGEDRGRQQQETDRAITKEINRAPR